MAGNAADLVRQAGREFSQAPAIISDNLTVSWGDLDAAVDRGAAALAQRFHRGDRLVIQLPTGRDLTVTVMAGLRADLVVVPIDPNRTDTAAVLARVRAAGLISGASGSALGPDEVRGWFDGAPAAPVQPHHGGEDLAVLARVSRPGGGVVMLSHRALLAAVESLMQAPRLEPRADDRILQVLPMFHLAGLVAVFLPAARLGAAIVIPPAPPAGGIEQVGTGAWAAFGAGVLESVRRHQVTVLPGAASLYRLLLRSPNFTEALAGVRLLTSGASALLRADAATIKDKLGRPVWESYGVSEASSAVASTLMTDDPRPGSVGLPLPGVEIKIERDPDLPLSDVPDDDTLVSIEADGDPGRICIRGPQLFSGYWPDGVGGPDADGWFTTSDIGYLDGRGELRLVDRILETVTVAGFTVYPHEVENALRTHPAVRDAAVVGLASGGENRLVASVVPRPGDEPSEEDLAEHLANLLPPFKRPTRYRLVKVLPHTEVGRLDREAVHDMWAADSPNDEPAAGPNTQKLSVVPGGTPASGGAPTPEASSPLPAEIYEVSQLDELGSRLPGIGLRSRRSVEDTDSDLFGEEIEEAAKAEEPAEEPQHVSGSGEATSADGSASAGSALRTEGTDRGDADRPRQAP